MVSEQWKIQNKLYQMKARKQKLESILEGLKKTKKPLDDYTLLRQEGEPLFHYIVDVSKNIFLELDKVIEIYYYKLTTFLVIRKVEKAILTLTKEIKHYE